MGEGAGRDHRATWGWAEPAEKQKIQGWVEPAGKQETQSLAGPAGMGETGELHCNIFVTFL